MSKVNRVHQRLARELSKKEGIGYQQALEQVQAQTDIVQRLVARVTSGVPSITEKHRQQLLQSIEDSPLHQMTEEEALVFINQQMKKQARDNEARQRTLESFVKSNFISAALYDDLIKWMSNGKSLVVVGNMGSGKTSLVQAILNTEVLLYLRTVVVEQVPELIMPDTSDCDIATLAQDENTDTSMKDLVRMALIKNPQRLILSEAWLDSMPLLMQSSIFSDGKSFVTTFHSNSARQAITRMTLGLQLQNVEEEMAWALLSEGVDVIITTQKDGDKYQVSEVHQVMSNSRGYRMQGTNEPSLRALYQIQNGQLQSVNPFDEQVV